MVTPVVNRPLAGPGVPIEMLMSSLSSAAGEGVPTVLLRAVEEERRLYWEMAEHGAFFDLPWPVEEGAQLLTVTGDETVAVATLGAAELVVLSVGDGEVIVERWPVPEGVVTGLYAHSLGLICVSTVALDPTAYPGEFPAGRSEEEAEEAALFADHLWFWDRGDWGAKPLVLEEAAVLAGHRGTGVGFPSADAVLVLGVHDLLAGRDAYPVRLKFLLEGDVHHGWPLNLSDSPAGAPRLALGVTGEGLPRVILWDGRHVAAYGDGGGEPSWVFKPSNVASGESEVTGAFVSSGGTVVVTSGDTVHFLDQDGHVTAHVALRSQIAASLPLPDYLGAFFLLTEDQIFLYDERARRLWSEALNGPPLAWDIFAIEDADRSTCYVGVATAGELIQYRIDPAR